MAPVTLDSRQLLQLAGCCAAAAAALLVASVWCWLAQARSDDGFFLPGPTYGSLTLLVAAISTAPLAALFFVLAFLARFCEWRRQRPTRRLYRLR